MREFVCPMCRKGIHNLCSPIFCDCQHRDTTLGQIIDDEGRLAQ